MCTNTWNVCLHNHRTSAQRSVSKILKTKQVENWSFMQNVTAISDSSAGQIVWSAGRQLTEKCAVKTNIRYIIYRKYTLYTVYHRFYAIVFARVFNCISRHFRLLLNQWNRSNHWSSRLKLMLYNSRVTELQSTFVQRSTAVAPIASCSPYQKFWVKILRNQNHDFYALSKIRKASQP